MRTRKGRKVVKTTKESKYHWAVSGQNGIVFNEMAKAFNSVMSREAHREEVCNRKAVEMLNLMVESNTGRRC